ncbi:flap endonuclease 1 [Ditylenchus destructor]|nr:flap endonuclease 1 [Ditylenchus destructor]
MGIKDLSKVLGDHAPTAIRTNEMKAYFGRKIAIDASMSLYQFLIAVRQDGAQLMDDNGETTRECAKEFSLEKILKCLEFTFEQFVDLCILLGCDYCPSIRGIGPKKAFELISQYKSIENILENIDQEKYPPPENWLFAAARKLFLHPEVTNGEEFQFAWTEPNIDDLIKFLCIEKGFSEDRIRTAIDRLKKSRTIAQQGRIDTFFKATATVTTVASSQKRKLEETKQKTKPGAAGKKQKNGKAGK